MTTKRAKAEEPPGPPKEFCAEQTQEAEQTKIDLFILLDKSGSMTKQKNLGTEVDRWTPVTTSLMAFLESTKLRGINVGLQFFPRDATKRSDPKICQEGTYEEPEVAFTPLSTGAGAIRDAITRNNFTAAQSDDAPHWGTPTRPAVEGSFRYLDDWADANPDRQQIVILATDGEPIKFCNENEIADIASFLQDKRNGGRPRRPTWWALATCLACRPLPSRAFQGQDAFIVDADGGQKTQDELTEALESIQERLELPCRYNLPAQGVDPYDQFNAVVRLNQLDGNVVELNERIGDESDCGATPRGWYFDDNGVPSEIRFCSESCEIARSRTVEKVEISFRCQAAVE